jgi:CDP-diacylglycerol---glycerol-3-phosphate 3-phosphatidyltransferase
MATLTPSRPTVFTVPNQLTASRFVLAIVLFVLIELHVWVACLAVFVVAAFTDWLDGYLARRQGQSSSLGRNLDPLVDKVLVCGAYIFLLPVGIEQNWLYPWMVTVIVARELVITGLRGYMETLGAKFGADWLGKLKMGLQCSALLAIFMALQAVETGAAVRTGLVLTRDVLVYAMLAATLLSGLQYLWRAFALLRQPEAEGCLSDIPGQQP